MAEQVGSLLGGQNLVGGRNPKLVKPIVAEVGNFTEDKHSQGRGLAERADHHRGWGSFDRSLSFAVVVEALRKDCRS